MSDAAAGEARRHGVAGPGRGERSEPWAPSDAAAGEARRHGVAGPGRGERSEPWAPSDAGAAADGSGGSVAAREESAPVGRRLVPDADLPAWIRPVVNRADGARLPQWVRHATERAPDGARHSAVLMLLGNAGAGPELLLTGRAATLRSHAGQPAFPGGALDPGEDAVAGALREAREETALDPDSVTPAAVLPQLYLRPSGFVVHPVLALWRRPGPVRVVDPAETAVVARVPVAELVDPANRGIVQLRLGMRTPAFTVAGLVVWGFTAGLVDLLLEWGGWSVPWDTGRVIALDVPVPRIANPDPRARVGG